MKNVVVKRMRLLNSAALALGVLFGQGFHFSVDRNQAIGLEKPREPDWCLQSLVVVAHKLREIALGILPPRNLVEQGERCGGLFGIANLGVQHPISELPIPSDTRGRRARLLS